jgi:3'-phosphoadenosine 5'-phosphosulfate sulfotransferase (PAPS reductase)/FAD synthetase
MPFRTPPERPTVTPGSGSQQQYLDRATERLESEITDDTAFLWTGGKEAQVIADLLLYAVGDVHESSPVPFITIDTGNHYDAMYDFREDYATESGIGPETGIEDWRTIRHDKLLDGVLQNDDDPRQHHGAWDTSVDIPPTNSVPVDNLPRSKDSWNVEISCGAAKVVPLRQLITDDGFTTLITGRRSSDPLTPGNQDTELDVTRDRHEPAPHTRINPLADWSEANVYAFLKAESVPLCSLYTQQGLRHTDAACCVDKDAVGEYGEGGRDPEKQAAKDRLEEMGYV